MGEKVKAFGKLPQILTFPFKDQGWFGKMAIATLIMLAGSIVPILPTIILLGYFYEMVRRIIVDGEDASLPEWEDWGGFLSNGFKWFASTLIITVPFFVVFLLTMGLYFVPVFFIESGVGENLMAGYFAFLFFAQFIMMFVSIIFMTFMGVFAPVYMVHIVAEDDFKSMFQIKQWWKIFAKGFWEFLISFLLLYGIAMIVGFVYGILMYSVVCCCLAPFVLCFGSVYIMAIYMALVAGAYHDGRDKVPTEDAPKALDEGSVIEPESLPAPEPVEELAVVEEVEEIVEEFDIPSPDGDGVEDATEIAVPVVEEVVEEVPAMDATLVSGVNEEVAEAMGYAEATVKMDNLKKINGIGPKTAGVLNQNGILTYGQLAGTSVEQLKEILETNGLGVVAAACEDWPQQAKDMI